MRRFEEPRPGPEFCGDSDHCPAGCGDGVVL